MLATKADPLPRGADWLHEVKWDGVRTIAQATAGLGDAGVATWTRNGNASTTAWPDVAAVGPDADVVVDGEVIALNARGLPDFRVLQERMHVRRAATAARLAADLPATFMVFDLLRLEGRDLLEEPLEERRALLAQVLDGSGWQVPASYDDGEMLLEATRTQGLEGVVAKRRGSRYRPGERSPHWRKLAHRHRGSYVVGGWRPQEGGTQLAALLVGERTPDGLAYRGRVGSGIGPRASRRLTELVAGLTRAASPFDDEVPRADAAGTTWLEPTLVVDVETHGSGHDRLRQPSLVAVRTDLTPDEI
ncbi:DNA ligase [Nocardioides sp. GY 10127]|nr:DNA ligase [Nocardioides sp. GY 10127]